MPARQRRGGGAAVMSTPLRRIKPAAGRSSPAMRLTSVDLPAPFGPMMPTASPGAMARSRWAAACTEPKDLERRRISRIIALIANGAGRCPAPHRPDYRGSGDRLHLAADRDRGRGLIVGDDDVVLVAPLDAPLGGDQGRLCHG